MRKLLILLFYPLLLIDCATAHPTLSTPSGRPEIFIPNVSPEQVKQVIIDRELSKGWQLSQDTPYQVTFTRHVNSVGAIISFGSQFNGIPDARTRFTITSVQNGTKVYLNGDMVTNPGSAFEKVYPIEDTDKNAFAEMQKGLEAIKAAALSANSTSSGQ